MTITKTFASKLFVALVAAAMVVSAFAPAARAQTTEDLQQMINDLLAQVAALQGQIGQGGSSVASGVCPYTWTRDLSSGSTGGDVMKLQQFLNADPDTRVSVSGAGSAGMETEYYGPATAAAVSKFQVKYRSEILSPANLVNPTGYFGPSSRGKANALCVSAPADTSDDIIDVVFDDTIDDIVMDDDDDTTGPTSLSGEASLDSFDIDDADDDTVQEGQDDVEVGVITVQFSDGDAEISRLDVRVVGPVAASDPWDAFDNLSLWVDGDKIAEESTDSKSDYLGDEDNGIVRFSGLDLVGMEDEDVEITVAATIQNNLDANELGLWTLDVTSMRFFDADGVASTEEDPTLDNATFTVEVEGADDELKVKESSNDPDATTLLLQTDNKETYTTFVFDLDTDDSTNDVQVNELTIRAVTTSGDLGDYASDAALIVDGQEVDTQDVTIGTSTIVFEFDDGDFVIDAGDRVEVELEVKFFSLDPANEGDSVSFSLDPNSVAADVDSEGADDITATGAAQGETHIMITEGIVILADGVETDTSVTGTGGDNPVGSFTIEFEVTAYENDYYISATSSVAFTVDGSTSTPSYTLTSTGNEDTTDVFTVNDGSTETFTLKVNVNPVIDGDIRVTLDSVDYSDNSAYYAGGVETIETRDLSPESDYRTAYLFVQGQ